MLRFVFFDFSFCFSCFFVDVPDDTGLDKIERCMCACKAIAPVGKGVFLEASLKYGCKAKQIGYMDKAYEELCLFPDDGLQQQSFL